MVYCLVILFILLLLKPYYILSFKKHLIPILIILLMIGTICFSKNAVQAAKENMLLWANQVIPALLPFFIFVELLKQSSILEKISTLFTPVMHPLFGIPGCGAIAFLMGIISGYPVGAIACVNLYEKGFCSKNEAEKMIAFTNSSGPLFIIGAIGTGMFSNQKIGLLLLTTHALAGITVGILFKNIHFPSKSSSIIPRVSIKSNTSSEIRFSTLGKNMKIAIQNSLSTLFMILGYMVFFGILGTVLNEAKLLFIPQQLLRSLLSFFHLSGELSTGILNGILEITGGIKQLSSVANATLIEKLATTAFILGFGGLSVLMQVFSIISEAKLSIKPYLLGKLLQGILASIYTIVLLQYENTLQAIFIPVILIFLVFICFLYQIIFKKRHTQVT